VTELPRYLRDSDPHKEPAPDRGHVNGTPLHADAYARKAFRDELDVLARQTQPGRNHQLNKSAFNLAQLVGSALLDHDSTWDALYATARQIGLPHAETTNTLHSAFRAGIKQPRQVAQYGQDEPPPVTVVSLSNGHSDTDSAHDTANQEGEDLGAAIRRRFPPLDWQALWEDDEEEEWIAYPLLPARRFVALFSAPKVGKSLLLLELAVAVARGETVLGHTPDRPRRVLYLDFENDPRGDVRTRLQAMHRKPDELADLVYLSYPSLAYLDTFAGAAELLAICTEYGVEVVVIDTISRAVGGEENDNDTWLGLYRNTGVALKRAGIAAIRLDHTGKDATKGMRGGSAKYGDVDAVWSMARLTESTYRLECTANRLPIAEKVLIVERALNPLGHTVTTRSTGDVVQDEVEAHIEAMDRLGLAPETGRDVAARRLKEAGFAVNINRLKAALPQRKERHGLTEIHIPTEDS